MGMQRAMAMCAFVALLGVLVTHFFIPKYDSNTLALADARFEEEEEGEGEEGEELEEGEEPVEDEADEETGLKSKKPVKKPTSANLKLIVIALEHDCLLTVKEDDPRYKDICLIRHEEDVYCEDIDGHGQRHRHYSNHSSHYQNSKTFSNSSCENIPYQAIQNDPEFDGSSSGGVFHPPPLRWTRPTTAAAPPATSTSTSTSTATAPATSTTVNNNNITTKEGRSQPSSNKPTNISSTTQEETKQRYTDMGEDDDDNDSINSDMSDSELYRRLEAARMQYEIRERESAASACL